MVWSTHVNVEDFARRMGYLLVLRRELSAKERQVVSNGALACFYKCILHCHSTIYSDDFIQCFSWKTGKLRLCAPASFCNGVFWHNYAA